MLETHGLSAVSSFWSFLYWQQVLLVLVCTTLSTKKKQIRQMFFTLIIDISIKENKPFGMLILHSQFIWK